MSEEEKTEPEPEPTVDAKGRPFISMAEVAEHKKQDDIWMVIHNKVYDVSAYLDDHPGGMEVLLDKAGDNATPDFEDVGHSADARKTLDQYEKGELVMSERTAEGEGASSSSGGGVASLMLPLVVLLLAAGAGYYMYATE